MGKTVRIDEVLLEAPSVLLTLSREFLRRGDEEYKSNQRSQLTACFFLALRSVSLLASWARILDPHSRDSSEVLARAFLEARDLLLTFRFSHKGTQDKIGYWFAGKADSSWKPEHNKCEDYMARLGFPGAEFAKRWSMTTTLAHPTVYACKNSTVTLASWAPENPRQDDFHSMMEAKVADFLASIASLIVIAMHDLPDLVALQCDPQRLPGIDEFRTNAFAVSKPVLDRISDGDLTVGSYRH